MSSNPRVDQLESLLARVRLRAQEPRALGLSLESPAAPASVRAAAPVSVREVPPLSAGEIPAPEPLALSPLVALQPPSEPLAPSSQDFEEIEDLDDIEEVAGGDLDFDEPEPESHSSPVAGSMEQALASAALAPPLTPPPESGAEEVQAVQVPHHPGPTMEQLGETISLEEGPNQAFELDEPLAEASLSEPPISGNLLEADLPGSRSHIDDEHLTVPDDAHLELARVRLGQTAGLEAEVVQRPQISTNVVDFIGAHRTFAPQTFAELVDASLSL